MGRQGPRIRTCPPVSDDPVWVNGFHRRMLGLSAQWMQFRSDTNSTNSVAPLLVSSRQGLGKSTFCRLRSDQSG